MGEAAGRLAGEAKEKAKKEGKIKEEKGGACEGRKRKEEQELVGRFAQVWPFFLFFLLFISLCFSFAINCLAMEARCWRRRRRELTAWRS